MLEQTFLRRLVVVRRDLQRTIRPGLLGFLREINRLACGIAAGAGEHLDFAGREFHGECHDMNVLRVIHRGRFPRGADGHNAIHAALDLVFDQARERGFVNFPMLKRRYDCSVGSSEHNSNELIESENARGLARLKFFKTESTQGSPTPYPRAASIESNCFRSMSVAVPATMCPAMLRKIKALSAGKLKALSAGKRFSSSSSNVLTIVTNVLPL